MAAGAHQDPGGGLMFQNSEHEAASSSVNWISRTKETAPEVQLDPSYVPSAFSRTEVVWGGTGPVTYSSRTSWTIQVRLVGAGLAVTANSKWFVVQMYAS